MKQMRTGDWGSPWGRYLGRQKKVRSSGEKGRKRKECGLYVSSLKISKRGYCI